MLAGIHLASVDLARQSYTVAETFYTLTICMRVPGTPQSCQHLVLSVFLILAIQEGVPHVFFRSGSFLSQAPGSSQRSMDMYHCLSCQESNPSLKFRNPQHYKWWLEAEPTFHIQALQIRHLLSQPSLQLKWFI